MATEHVDRAHHDTEKNERFFYMVFLKEKRWGKGESALLEIMLGRLELVTEAQGTQYGLRQTKTVQTSQAFL